MSGKIFDAARVYARYAEPVREKVARCLDKCIAAVSAYHQISLWLLRNFLWKLYARPVMRRFAGFRPSDDLAHRFPGVWLCLLYTSDAADESRGVDLGGRRI